MTPTSTTTFRPDVFAGATLALAAVLALIADFDAGITVTATALVIAAAWSAGTFAALVTGAAVAVVALVLSASLRQLDIWPIFLNVLALAAITAAWARRQWNTIVTRGPVEQKMPSEPAPDEASTMGRLAVYFGLPVLAAMVWLNLSDVIARRTPIPSLLQPLIAVLLLAAIIEWRRLPVRRVLTTSLVLLSMVWATVLLLRSAWAPDVSGADARLTESIRGLVILVLVATLAATWKALDRAVIAIAMSAAFLALLTLFQSLTGRWDVDFGGLARSERAHIFGELRDVRPGGPLGDPNFYGQILLVAVPLAVFAGWRRRGTPTGVVLLAGAAIATLGTLFTYSRGAILALAFVLLFIVAALRIPLKYVAIAAIAGLVVLPENLSKRFLTFVRSEPGAIAGSRVDSSLEGRRVDAATALLMFDDHPLFGAGTGSFTYNYGRYANVAGSSSHYYEAGPTRAPHSLYLEIAAENGITGLVAFAAAMAAAFIGLRRARIRLVALGQTDRAGIATALTIALAGYLLSSVFLHGAFQRYLWLLLGLSAAVMRLASRESSRPEVSP
jgi:O-antigen ligase